MMFNKRGSQVLAIIGTAAVALVAMTTSVGTAAHPDTSAAPSPSTSWGDDHDRDETRSLGNSNRKPSSIRMTWFGITNWHYQIGDLGIVLDGAIGNAPAIVEKARKALETTGDIDYLLVGHNHSDHTEDTLNWAAQTGAPVIAPKSVCENFASQGLPAGQCMAVKGGETVKFSKYVEMRVVRYVHSVECGRTSPASGGTETLGYLFTVQTSKKLLTLYTTDSGAGGPELVKEHIVDGENRGAPLSNLAKAMRNAGISSFDVWQAGPESRPVSQARVIIPAFQPKYFMPHHIAARGGFDLLGGMHYPYDTGEFPELTRFLAGWDVPNVYPTNYFDAWVYDASGMEKVDNAKAKEVIGLPADGPGPKPQTTNPRTGQLECAGD